MEKKPVYDKNLEEDNTKAAIPVQFIGITGKKITKNPFRKKGKPAYVLDRGALYMISNAQKEEFEAYLKRAAMDMTEQYSEMEYTERVRQTYKRHWNQFGSDYDAGMIMHYWVKKHDGLEALIVELKDSNMLIGLIFGKRAAVDLNELIHLAFNQIGSGRAIRKEFEAFVAQQKENTKAGDN